MPEFSGYHAVMNIIKYKIKFKFNLNAIRLRLLRAIITELRAS